MPSEFGPDVKFEIGHVLFIDIVGYTKLLIHEQTEHLRKLREIARATEQFRAAEAEGKLLRLPTGDGGALVFHDSPEAPVTCALEMSKALKNHPDLRVRMGIHSGPVKEVTDLNEQANIAGAGINIAQRVMDCGDAGHILVSKRVADDLEQYGRWRPLLHDLGICEVTHGATLGIVNLYSDEIGNPETPKKFKAEETREKTIETGRPVPHKSIAVLPFENLSEDKANVYFADGIHEQVLTRLSRIRDLKVISRTSTQRFKNTAEQIPDIAKQLGVATILEGSVRKAGDKVRVHVQLIDAENDAHLWPEAYNTLAAVEIYYKRNWTAAERAFHRGMELDPNFGDLHSHYGLCLSYLGRFDEAIAQTERALQLDPFFPGTNLPFGTLLFFSRQYDRAAAQLAKTLDLYPDNAAAHEYFGNVCAKRGMAHEAITHWCSALNLNGRSEDARVLEQTFKAAGSDAAVRTLGERQLEELDAKRVRGEYVAAAHYVFAHIKRGNLEDAFGLLPKMAEEPDWFALQMRVNPILDPLRTDPRFGEILAALTLKN